MVREGRVFISPTSNPAYGIGYYVQALEVGAQVTSASSGTTVTVRAGHGFAAGDKYMNGTDVTTFSGTLTVQSITSTTLVLSSAYAVSEGDLLVNLGADTGTSEPNYDGAGLTIYTDMDYSNAASRNTVLTDQYGRYRYWHKGIARWELVRSATGLVALYTDTGAASAANINVLDYGAVGDGVTDDVSAIQSALNAVPSTGGSVYIPSGTYIISKSIWVKSNTLVRGDGMGATTLKRSANSLSATVDAFQYNNAMVGCGSAVLTPYTNSSPGSSITFCDFTVNGNYANQSVTDINNRAYGVTTGTVVGTDTGGCIDGLTVQRVQVINIMQDGFYVANSNNVLIDSCVCYKTGQTLTLASKNAISFTGGPTDLANGWCNNLSATNNRISYSGDAVTRAAGSPSSEGIAVIVGDNVRITGNDISFVDYGVEGTYTTSGSYTNHNWLIANNVIHDLRETATCESVGITVSRVPAQNLLGLTISGNTIYNVNCNGIYAGGVGGGVSGLSITGNTLYATNLLADATLFCAIDVIEGSEVSCTGNSVSLIGAVNGTYGIRFYAVTGGVMSSNTVTNDNGSATAGNIIINVGTMSCLITGNRLTGNKYGIYIGTSGSSAGNTMFGNYITGTITATYLDSSGATNYNYGSVDVGAWKLPSLQSLSSNVGTWVNPTATSGTDTDCTNGTIYAGSICCPAGMTITGVKYLIGSVGGTDKVIVSLHNYLGTFLVGSDTAGTTVGTAATVQSVPFTTSHTIFQPTWFHIGLTFNGTTAKFRTIPAQCGAGNGVVGGSRAQTFGTPASFTAWTTFNADLIPVMSIY